MTASAATQAPAPRSDGEPAPRPAPRTHPNPLLLAGLAALAALLTGVGAYRPPAYGGADVDPGFMTGLLLAATQGLRFGPELVYTYGPLGWLMVGRSIEGWHAVWWTGLSFALTFAALLMSLVLMTRRRSLATSAVVLLAMTLTMWMTLDERALLALAIAALLLVLRPRGRFVIGGSALFGAAAAILLLTKFSAGVIALGLLAIVSLALWRRPRAVLAAWAAFAVSTAGLWLLAGQSLGDLPSWARLSAEVAVGYNGAQATYQAGGGPAALTLCFVVLSAGMVVLGWRAARADGSGRATAWLVALLLAFVAFTCFKNGFVNYRPAKSFLFLVPFVTWALPATWPRWQRAVATAVTPALVLVSLLPYDTARLDLPGRLAMWQQRLSLVLDGQELQAALAQARESTAADFDLPATIRQEIGSRGAQFDPHDPTPAWTYGLRWDPTPVFQTYLAFTPALDEHNARAARARTADQPVVIYDTATYEQLNPLWTPPRYQLALTCGYVQSAAEGRWEVWTRGADRCGPERPLAPRAAGADQRVDLPAVGEDEFLIARFTPRGSAWESLMAALYKPPRPALISLDDDTYRISNELAGSPLIASCPPAEGESFRYSSVCPSPATIAANSAGTWEFSAISMS